MLIDRVAEVVHVEVAAPVGKHRLVVVGPAIAVGGIGQAAVGSHGLDVVYTDHGRECAVVHVGIREFGSCVVDAVLCREGSRTGESRYGQESPDEKSFHGFCYRVRFLISLSFNVLQCFATRISTDSGEAVLFHITILARKRRIGYQILPFFLPFLNLYLFSKKYGVYLLEDIKLTLL